MHASLWSYCNKTICNYHNHNDNYIYFIYNFMLTPYRSNDARTWVAFL